MSSSTNGISQEFIIHICSIFLSERFFPTGMSSSTSCCNVRFVSKMMNFILKMMSFALKNDEFCIENGELNRRADGRV